jgi:hypothetical protein
MENILPLSLPLYHFLEHFETTKWFVLDFALFPTFTLAEQFTHNAGARWARVMF